MSSKKYQGKVAADLRAYWTRQIEAAGVWPCWRCGRWLTLDSPWHVGHVVDRMDGGPDIPANTRPECAKCNTRAGGKRGAAITNARRRKPSTSSAPTKGNTLPW